MRHCSVCNHPEKDEINRLIERGYRLRDIAFEYCVSEDALSRHKKNHLKITRNAGHFVPQNAKIDPWRHKRASVVAAQLGCSERTVRRAAKFQEALEEVERISPVASQKIQSGEVIGAITYLPALVHRRDLLTDVVRMIERQAGRVRLYELVAIASIRHNARALLNGGERCI